LSFGFVVEDLDIEFFLGRAIFVGDNDLGILAALSGDGGYFCERPLFLGDDWSSSCDFGNGRFLELCFFFGAKDRRATA
jgi:hypothetical protein